MRKELRSERNVGLSLKGELMEDYRSRLYAHYVSTHLASFRDISQEAFEKQRVVLRSYSARHLPKDRNAKILDIGCGYGCFLYHLQKEGYENAIGVDTSSEQVELARKLGVRNVECEDLMQYLGKNSKQFDAITAFDVVEHFRKEELLPLLDAIFLALKPGGIFIMQSPNADGPFGCRYRYYDFTHELAFTKTSASQVLSAVGFRTIAVYPTDPVCHGFISTCRWLLWQALRFILGLYLAIETGCFRGHILTQNLLAVAKK